MAFKLCCVALVVSLAGCVSGDEDVRRPDDPSDDPSTDPSDDVVPSDAFTESPAPNYLQTPQITSLADRIDALLSSTSASHSVAIVDLDNGQIVYESDPDHWLKPASNTKLFTTGVSLAELGPEHRSAVTAYADDEIVGGEVRELVIVGEHDGSWSSWLQVDPTLPATVLAQDLHRAGLRRVAGDLVVRGDYAVEAQRFGTYDPGAHRSAAASVLRDALEVQGIAVHGGVRLERGLDLARYELAQWRGPTLAVVAARINRLSHNELADLLARHLGYEVSGDGTYPGSEAVIEDWLLDNDLDLSEFNLDDGSGLSHTNRVTANLIVGMFGALDESPAWTDFERSLSVAGSDGTLAGRMGDSDTLLRVLGKSGTLNGVITTSGVLHHRYDGHRYAFSILMNDAWDRGAARGLQDRVVAELAHDLRGVGARPPAPELRSFVQHGDGSATLQWSADDAADTIVLWLSSDGQTWSRDNSRGVQGARYTLGELAVGERVYARLSAVNEAGWSEVSDVLCVRVGDGPSVALLVDGDDRWAGQWENPLGQGHDFVARVGQALELESWDSAHHGALVDGELGLESYNVVLWQAGEMSTEHMSLGPAQQDLLWDYTDDGGALLLSGAEIAWDLGLHGDSADQEFFREVLRAEFVADAADAWHVSAAEAAFVDTPVMSFLHPGHQVVDYPDVLRPVGGARAALVYVGDSDGAAAVRYSGEYELLYLGFPVEMVDGIEHRSALLAAAMGALGVD